MSEWNSEVVRVFQGLLLPEPATPVGYAAIWEHFDLRVPLPLPLAAIAQRHGQSRGEEWLILTPRHAPERSLAGHLEFALKWEGVNLGILKALFQVLTPADLTAIIRKKPTGAYTRRIWFLYEWLMDEELPLEALGKVRSVPVLDPKHHYVLSTGFISKRHKVVDNLPGTRAFCPLVRRTEALEELKGADFGEQAKAVIGRSHPDLVARAAAFLLLSDSRASFGIEGEQPSHDRAERWGQAISEAGTLPLSVEELERLQSVVIGDDRFVNLGLRKEGGFVGDHDRNSGAPIPEHISARPDDLPALLDGLVTFVERAVEAGMDPVVTAACAAFGFVYLHPFEDGNGRIHRWIIHHVLSTFDYNPPGVVLPISAAILRHILAYRRVLESRSKPLLRFIEWRPTDKGNVEVLNQTADYYRYFDATPHTEFLYLRVKDTVEKDLPEGVAYLEAFDRFRAGVEAVVDMPSRTIDLLHRFLRQGQGTLSKRARAREFHKLSEEEVARFETLFQDCFGMDGF